MSSKEEIEKGTKIVKHIMLAPLVRVKIEPEELLDFQISEGVRIIYKNTEIFKKMQINDLDFNAQDILSTTNKFVFTYYPLLYVEFAFIENYPDISHLFFDIFVMSLGFFKTTYTKLKIGISLVVNYDEKEKRNGMMLSGSDDYLEGSHLKSYLLKKEELEDFKKFYNIFINSWKITNDKILMSMEFYSKAGRANNMVEKFIFLSLSLEFLLSREDDELSNRFANRMALLLGNTNEERTNIAKNVKKLYTIRSKIVHGTAIDPPTSFEFGYLNELMRSAILQQISLTLSGVSDIISELDSFILKQNTEDYAKFKEIAKQTFGSFSDFRYANLGIKDIRLDD